MVCIKDTSMFLTILVCFFIYNRSPACRHILWVLKIIFCSFSNHIFVSSGWLLDLKIKRFIRSPPLLPNTPRVCNYDTINYCTTVFAFLACGCTKKMHLSIIAIEWDVFKQIYIDHCRYNHFDVFLPRLGNNKSFHFKIRKFFCFF